MSTISPKRSHSASISIGITALLLVTILGQARFYENLKWDAPQIVAAAFRGKDGNAKPVIYTEIALRGLYGNLMTAVSGGFEKVTPARKKLVIFGKKFEYTLSTKLNELFDGALTVEVVATAAGGKTPVKSWTHTVEKGADAAKSLDTFGATVGAELARLPK